MTTNSDDEKEVKVSCFLYHLFKRDKEENTASAQHIEEMLNKIWTMTEDTS